jgi:hypothetical protein
MAHTQVRSSTRPPLAIDPEREQRIRERAYHLWEADGKPYGHDVEYWERARELTGVEESAGSDLLPDPQTVPDRPRQSDIEKPGTQAKRREFPDRLADNGEVKTTPVPKRRARAKPKKPA